MLLASVSATLILLHVACGSSINFPRASSGSTAPQPDYVCTNSVDFVGDAYRNEDCKATVQRLYNVEAVQHGATEFEFLAAGATNTTGRPAMQTPRRYTVGKSLLQQVVRGSLTRSFQGQCTLAIVMLDFFEEGSLPGEDPSGQYIYSNTDVTSFDHIWHTAGLVLMNCMVFKRSPGWAPIGMTLPLFLCSPFPSAIQCSSLYTSIH